MPPRYAYWTILIDDKPTAFRAREREELQPTFVQLQRKNANVTMQWFARGKLWASREAERDDFQTQKHAASAPREARGDRPPAAERRGSDWRPGGAHKDPRDRFKKKNRPERGWSEKDPATQRERDKPGWRDKPVGPAGGGRPWQDKSKVAQGFRPAKPAWRDEPAGPPRGDRPPGHRSSFDSRKSEGGGQNKPASGPPRGDRPWSNKPPSGEKGLWSGKRSDRSGPPRERKPWQDKPGSAPPNDRPWQTKPTGPRAQRKPWVGKPGPPGEGAGFKPRGDRPWTAKPPSGGKRPWSDRPPDRSGPREQKPGSDKPAGGPPRGDRPPDPRSSYDSRKTDAGWSGKPRDPNRKPFTPRGPRQGGAAGYGAPRKPRGEED